MDNQKNTKSSRGAIAAGLFIALYLVIFVIIGVICMPIAVLFLLMPELLAFFAAPVYHTMLTKAPGWISIFLAAVIPSLVLIATGHIPIAPLVSVPAGLIAVLLSKKGQYKSFKWNTISHMVFSLNVFGGFLPIWFMREYFFQRTLKGGMSQAFVDTVRLLTPWWGLLVMMIATALCSLLGSLFTKKVLHKRLEKAGIV
ncbi:MAG: MptD family putative ECF transporter S component [Treponema sp.]|jgi:hypothetical protein|uniref:MptD family putative ECF transporter S component n=1 Tax=unclassified Treponema TaxID=2638727 RepID=UPI0020A5C0BA|nr:MULTISPECIES: MptD family putative ECF transporter S component [unclassified Treponema]UTC52776.1 MptD family putative ECF transporter S component [Treponema sp. OMZ 803]UTC55198.1 MptD family putative ECF transporter S component [Treponema sp. OMZ 906]